MVSTLIIIAENIHASRVVLTPERNGKKTRVMDNGAVGLIHPASDGDSMSLPHEYRETEEYAQGKIKHVRVAIELGMAGDTEGVRYLQSMARSQIQAGADFLDVNIDEMSSSVEKLVDAMNWTAGMMTDFSPVPLSIDSSVHDVLEAGLKCCDHSKGRPLINSASMERPEVLDLAVEYNTDVVVSAFGGSAGPLDVDERMKNFGEMMKRVDSLGIEPERVYLDPLVFSVGTDPEAGNRFLEAVRRVRDEFGDEVHITGGLSNISFGMPARRLLNEVFVLMAMEAGCDSAIVDPLQVNVERIRQYDRDSEVFRLTMDALTGKDQFCVEYISAYREGKLRV